jgi:EAL domain-containing protein (putative c-di-GMP-specific phosphodiesterase class I)
MILVLNQRTSISRIDFDGIKMSKELFWDLYARDRTLLRHLIKLMKSKANIAVIEGVDTFDKYIFCRERNCLMQGYFFIEIERKGVS